MHNISSVIVIDSVSDSRVGGGGGSNIFGHHSRNHEQLEEWFLYGLNGAKLG